MIEAGTWLEDKKGFVILLTTLNKGEGEGHPLYVSTNTLHYTTHEKRDHFADNNLKPSILPGYTITNVQVVIRNYGLGDLFHT